MIPYSSVYGWTTNQKNFTDSFEWMGTDHTVIMQTRYLLPFQFPKEKTGGNVTSLKLINLTTGVETEILTDARTKGFTMHSYTDFDLVVWPGFFALDEAFTPGVYRLKMTDSTNIYWSQKIGFRNDVSDYVKVTYYHQSNFGLKKGNDAVLRYDGSYKNWFYLAAVIKAPEYIIEEETDDNLGSTFEYQVIAYKKHMMSGVQLPEFLCDHCCLILQQHDYVIVNWRDNEWTCDDILFTPSWDAFADVADVEVEFRTDTIAVTNGQAVGESGYTPGSQSCLVVDYSALALITKQSSDFTNGTYSNGSEVPNLNDFMIVQELPGILRLYRFNGSAYILFPLTTEGLVVFDSFNAEYYFVQGFLLYQSKINSVITTGVDTYTVNGKSFTNTELVIRGELVDSQTVELARFFNDDTVAFSVSVSQANLRAVRVEPQSNACTNFADSEYKIVSTNGVGYDVVGTDLVVYSPVEIM